MSELLFVLLSRIEKDLEKIVSTEIINVEVDEIFQEMYASCLRAKLMLKAVVHD
jgi:hypothetical protein